MPRINVEKIKTKQARHAAVHKLVRLRGATKKGAKEDADAAAFPGKKKRK